MFDLAIRTCGGVANHGRIGQGGVVLAADDLRGDIGLQLVRHDGDLLLSVSFALLRQLFRIGFLCGACLDGDGRAAGVGGVEVLRVAGRDAPCGSHIQVGDHVDLLLSLRGDREGGEADIELRAKGGDNRGEFGMMRAALLEAHHLGQCLVDVDVVADGGLSVGGHVLGRSVTRRSAVA